MPNLSYFSRFALRCRLIDLTDRTVLNRLGYASNNICLKRYTSNTSHYTSVGAGHTFWKPMIGSLELGKRQKYTNKRTQAIEDNSDSEDENDDDDGVDDKASKVMKGYMASLRVDGVIKAGLGMARNKVETLFYESKIRVNGCKISKKSFKVNVGDEVDVIKNSRDVNEGFLNVSRIVVLSCKENEDGDGLIVKMRRYKTLTIEDYQNDP